MARGEKRRKRASVRVRIEVGEIGSSVRHDLIDVDLAETCEADDKWADHKIHELAEEAINRATMQTATVFEKPVEEPEEVGSE